MTPVPTRSCVPGATGSPSCCGPSGPSSGRCAAGSSAWSSRCWSSWGSVRSPGRTASAASSWAPTSPSLACPAPPTGPGGEWVTDSFYFVRQPLAGNGSITVRVTSLTGLYSTQRRGPRRDRNPTAGMTPGVQPWSKAGIIIKASTRQGSAYAAMMVTGSHGVRMQWDFTHDVAGLAGKVSAASPRWLRLTRSGDTITGYDSADGAHWTRVGTATLAGLPSTAQAGLFAASPGYSVTTTSLGGGSSTGGPTLATARLRPGEPAGHLARGPVDRPGHPGDHGQRRCRPRRKGSRRPQAGSPCPGPATSPRPPATSTAIRHTLAGTFAGLIAVVVIGVMFITAEYRRGLIRTTLTASPRRGRVLAAKAIVLGRGHVRGRAGRGRDRDPARRAPAARERQPDPAGHGAHLAAGRGRHRRAAGRVRRARAGRGHAAAAQRRGGHRGDRRHRAAVPARDDPRHPAGRRRAVAAPRHPGRRVRRPADHPQYPQVTHGLHAGQRVLPAGAVGRVRGAVRLGRRSPWPSRCSCCAGGTHDGRGARGVDEAAHPARHRLAAAGRGRADRGGRRGRGERGDLPGRGLPARPGQGQPHRGLPRPGHRRDRGRDRDQRRVQHRDDPPHAGRHAPPVAGAGRQGRRRQRRDPGHGGGRGAGLGAGRGAAAGPARRHRRARLPGPVAGQRARAARRRRVRCSTWR